MATRSEQFKSEEQRQRQGAPAKQAKRAKPPESRERDHAGQKATYAFEPEAADGSRTRKSTRKSANRAKPDAALNGREALQKGSPTARYRRSAARDGHGA